MQRVFYSLGLALILGLIAGLQRERTDPRLAGFRTFPLITIFGTLCGILGERFGGWAIAAGALSLAGVILSGNLKQQSEGPVDSGMTTEVAMLVMFGLGAYVAVGDIGVSIALGGVVAVLLHMKPQMHALAGKLGDRDFHAIMQFVVVSMIVLPLVPDRSYGPYGALNPNRIWMMVVLIVGLSVTAYIVYKFMGQKAGTLIGGILGGLISSTAATITFARRTRETPRSAPIAALAILLASATVYVRIIAIIALSAPMLLKPTVLPMIVMFVFVTAIAVGLWWWTRKERATLPNRTNPSELKAALMFGRGMLIHQCHPAEFSRALVHRDDTRSALR